MRDLAIAAGRYMLIGPVAGGALVLAGIGLLLVRALKAESRLEIAC